MGKGLSGELVGIAPRYFVIVPGHEAQDLETVIERHEGWAIVE
jgi:hypothetical protein